MIQMVQPAQARFCNWEFQISPQDKKVLAVALASLALLAVQLSFSWTLSLGLTALVLLTHFFSRNDNDWFNFQFDQRSIAFFSAFLILKPVIFQILFWALGIPLPPLAQEGIAKLILEEPWKWIPMATLVAPFTEEILFRGFLLEGLEGIGFSENISDIAQALIFGAVHLRRKIEEGMEIPIFLSLSAMGYVFSWLKREENSLIAPMAIHSANNIGACAYVFLSSRV